MWVGVVIGMALNVVFFDVVIELSPSALDVAACMRNPVQIDCDYASLQA